MECLEAAVSGLSGVLLLGGSAYFLWQVRNTCSAYGRYSEPQGRFLPSRMAWFLQESPSFLLPLLLLLLTQPEEQVEPEQQGSEAAGRSRWTETGTGTGTGRTLLVWTFMLHYFHRSFIYAFLTKGQPVPLFIVISAAVFCSLNGFLQGHFLLHCAHFQESWLTVVRLTAGYLLFVVGMVINIHSDHILRSLRRPKEHVYRIPRGGMFELVSGANYLGEIIEWCGYAVAVWALPAFAFAFFTICSIGPRAYHHHRHYQQIFKNYPRSRKAIIPFIL